MTLPPLPTPDLLLLGQLQSPVEGWTRSQVDAYGAACRAAALDAAAKVCEEIDPLKGTAKRPFWNDCAAAIRALKENNNGSG